MARPPPLSLLADRCTSMRQLKQVHAQMVVSGRISDNFAASRLLAFSALHPSGDLLHAASILRHPASGAGEPNTFMWNTLIRALAGTPDPSAAILLYGEMRRRGVSPGKHTFPFVLKASANLRSLPGSKQLHCQVLKHGLDLDAYVANGLIRCYASCGFVRDARKVFDGCPQRNPTVWTTMVSGYAQNSCSGEAMELFEEVLRIGVEPCGATMASALSACARSSDGLELGRRIHSMIREKGVATGVILGTALVDMYVKNGALSLAREMFDEMPERNTATWNAMICGMARHGHAEEALLLFREMKKTDDVVVPNDVTFVGVLSACCHAGWVELGRRVFQTMEADYGVEPKIEHLGCMVDLLGKSGRLSEAVAMIGATRWQADVVILGALLTACKNHGDVETAEKVALGMLALEPNNHSAFVVLSDMYAAAGRWEDVARLRKAMKHEGLKKVPAWSCVGDEGAKLHSSFHSQVVVWPSVLS